MAARPRSKAGLVRTRRRPNIAARCRWLPLLIAVVCGGLWWALDHLWPAETTPMYLYLYDRYRAASAEGKDEAVDGRLALLKLDDKIDLWTEDFLEEDPRFADRPIPMLREAHAQLLPSLAEIGTHAVVFDVVFVGRTRYPKTLDGRLAGGMAALPTVIALPVRRADGRPRSLTEDELAIVERFGLPREGPLAEVPAPVCVPHLLPAPIFVDKAAGIGHIARSVDQDGKVRRLPLFVEIDGRLIPSLTLATTLRTLGVDGRELRYEDGQVVLPRGGGGNGSRPIRIPLDREGHLLINHLDDWQHEIEHEYSYFTTWDTVVEFPEDAKGGVLPGKTVLIASTAADGTDWIATPLHEQLPGGMATFNAVNMILTGQFITPAPRWQVRVLAVAAPLLIGLMYVFGRVVLATIAAVATAGGLLAGSWLLFDRASYFLPIGLPVIALGTAWAAMASVSLVRAIAWAGKLSTILKRFVSPALLSELYIHGLKTRELHADRREVSVLFADIASFTRFSEEASPDLMRRFLRRWYELAIGVLVEHHCTLDKFMGDGVIAYCGAPEPVDDKEAQIVKATIALQRVFGQLADEVEQETGTRLRLRCGITSGEATVGYLGGAEYADYTLVGRIVNLAARLEQNAEPGHILVDRETVEGAGAAVRFEPRPAVQAKGIAEPIPVWEPVADTAGISEAAPATAAAAAV